MNTANSSLWRRFVATAKPFWTAKGKRTSWGLLAALLVLLVSVNLLNVVINFVSGSFMTALSEKDVPTFYRYLIIYGSVFVVGIPVVVLYGWVRDKLAVHWRKWLTNHLLDKYFAKRAYYRINNNTDIDNPDERIAQDVEAFTKSALTLSLVALGSIITLASFISILWSISLPLVATVVAYATLGSVATIWFGKRLIGLNFTQSRVEADFRYSLIHVRNNVESIAFYRGEEKESTQVKERFAAAFANFNLLIGWQRNLGFLTTGYDYLVVIIPSLVIAPLYFAGDVEFGAITQASMAFSQVLTALSLIVTEFRSISTFAANVNRLGAFMEALDAPEHKPGESVIATTVGETLALKNVTLYTPDYSRVLVTNVSARVNARQSLLIVGPSGSGKSSLLRTIAGLWDSGAGEIVRPSIEQILFLPQRPYMILGSLREQLLYPNSKLEATDAELEDVLKQVNLPDLAHRAGGLDTILNWSDMLSLGEQQRLAFARLILNKPRYAILDEATSALDVKNEEKLYARLRETGTTFVSVGHRPTLVKHHDQVLELVGDGNWKLHTAGSYNPA